jgi:hypothetical protein
MKDEDKPITDEFFREVHGKRKTDTGCLVVIGEILGFVVFCLGVAATVMFSVATVTSPELFWTWWRCLAGAATSAVAAGVWFYCSRVYLMHQARFVRNLVASCLGAVSCVACVFLFLLAWSALG